MAHAAANDWGIADPTNVNLDDISLWQAVCYLTKDGNDYDGSFGLRISSIFVIGTISTIVTFFPVIAKRVPRFRIPIYVYLFARYFGSGVIVATGFVHLLDPAYGEIGPQTCVGLTPGGWVSYSWPPAIALSSAMMVFCLEFAAERYVEKKYGKQREENIQELITSGAAQEHTHANDHRDSNGEASKEFLAAVNAEKRFENKFREDYGETDADERARAFAVQQQFAAFLILEFGVIFHSVIIGLNLGVTNEFVTLYIVLIFHQSFEGLGIGARLSAIPFQKGSWYPWALCSLYGVTTPLSIAIGIGLRNSYDPNGFTAQVIAGVLDSISAGILIYTGLVELLARDFLFSPTRTNDDKMLTFMMISVLAGAGIMALIGKWA